MPIRSDKQLSRPSYVSVHCSSDSVGDDDESSWSGARVVPSPRPDYIFALLMNHSTPYRLFHSNVQNRLDHEFGDVEVCTVRFLPQWNIKTVIEESMRTQSLGMDMCSAELSRERLSRLKNLSRIQSLVVKEYGGIRDVVWDWVASDKDAETQRREDCRTMVTIDSKTIRDGNGLVMQSYWRKHLGWAGDQTPNLIHKGEKFEFVTESYTENPAKDGTTVCHGKKLRWNYVWSHDKGCWMRASDCEGTKQKTRERRLKLLEQQVQSIMDIRNKALKEIGMGYLTGLDSNMSIPYPGRATISDNELPMAARGTEDIDARGGDISEEISGITTKASTSARSQNSKINLGLSKGKTTGGLNKAKGRQSICERKNNSDGSTKRKRSGSNIVTICLPNCNSNKNISNDGTGNADENEVRAQHTEEHARTAAPKRSRRNGQVIQTAATTTGTRRVTRSQSIRQETR